MNNNSHENHPGEMIRHAVDQMAVAVTIIDPEAKLLYYNRQAERILDRRPQYIGQDLRSHHKKPGTNKRFDAMMDAFKRGRREPFRYEASPYDRAILVTLSPLHVDGLFIGAVRSVMLKDDVP